MPPEPEEIEEIEVYFGELYRLMWAMVWDYANPDRMRLAPDEMFAELSLELVKVVQRYGGNGRTHTEIVKIIKTCLRNRCADLYVMEHKTHRRAEELNVSLEEFDEDGPDLEEMLPAIPDSSTYELLDGLSGDAKQLATLALHPNDNLMRQVWLAVVRKKQVAPKWNWRLEMTPYMLQRALGWDGVRFGNAWEEVYQALYGNG